jgi:hypothetical protein
MIANPAGYAREAEQRLSNATSPAEFDAILRDVTCRAQEFEGGTQEILDALPESFEIAQTLRKTTA